ncbi:MAG: hypothetical protein KY469_14535 [Actinobacteria bacterium]|nr:hypothetical protein [Actinomycetota bacterium]
MATDSHTTWDHQLTIGDVTVGDEVTPSSLELSVQKLAMIAGANRDFAPMHHDPEIARATGAPTAYANVMFVMAMMERTLLAWGGLRTRLRQLGPFRMVDFSRAGDTITCRGTVSEVDLDAATVTVDVWLESDPERRTAVGTATVNLPS